MSEYKTLDKIFQDGKPDGRKLQPMHSHYILDVKCRLIKRGAWVCVNQNEDVCVYNDSVVFREYVEPKKTKKVKMYKPIRKGYGTHYRTRADDEWHTDKDNFTETRTILGWLEMEAEIEL